MKRVSTGRNDGQPLFFGSGSAVKLGWDADGRVQRRKEKDAASGRYALGPTALKIGLATVRRMDPIALGGPTIDKLNEELNETVVRAVWSSRAPLIAALRQTSHPVSVYARVGTTVPLLNSANGRVFLAWLPATLTHDLVRHELELAASPYTTIKTRDDVEKLAEETRARGMARVGSELVPGIASLASPVFDGQGRLAMSLAVMGTTESFGSEWDSPIALALRAAAENLTNRLAGKISVHETMQPRDAAQANVNCKSKDGAGPGTK